MNPGCTCKYLFLIAAVLSQCVTSPLHASGQKDNAKTQLIAAVHAAENHTREQVKMQMLEEELLHAIPEKGNIRHSTGHYAFLFSLKSNGIISNNYRTPVADRAQHDYVGHTRHGQLVLPSEALQFTPSRYERFYYRQRETYSGPARHRIMGNPAQPSEEFNSSSHVHARQQPGHNPSQIKTPGALS